VTEPKSPTTVPTVDLVYDADCPNVANARQNLMRAFASARIAPHWREYRSSDPAAPAYAHGFGSPSILVNGADVAGESPTDGACCRLYDGGGGVPAIDTITRALRASTESAPVRNETAGRLRSTLAMLPGVGAALMPKLACPLCWPAYAAALGAFGMSFLTQARWLLPISATLLGLGLWAIAWRARSRRGYGPLGLALGGATAILFGEFVLDVGAVSDAGVAMFVGASVWNAWPRRGAAACAACERSSVTG